MIMSWLGLTYSVTIVMKRALLFCNGFDWTSFAVGGSVKEPFLARVQHCLDITLNGRGRNLVSS